MRLHPQIPKRELTIEYVRSAGPGGQNVNKVATKAQLRWRIGSSALFTFEQKERLRSKLQNHINKNDEVVITAGTTRSQLQNRRLAVQKLQDLVHRALLVQKKRRPTRPTRASKEKRLNIKKRTSEIKKMRKSFFE